MTDLQTSLAALWASMVEAYHQSGAFLVLLLVLFVVWAYLKGFFGAALAEFRRRMKGERAEE